MAPGPRWVGDRDSLGRRRSAVPAPPDRLARNLHLLGLGILAAETVFWLNQPCTGDVMCAPLVGVITLVLLVPGAVAVGVWRLLDRGSLLVLADAFLLSIALPIIPMLLAGGGSVDASVVLLFLVLPALVAWGVLGPVRDVARNRTESLLTGIALLAGAGLAIINAAPVLAIVPVVLALILAIAPPRPAPAPEPESPSGMPGPAVLGTAVAAATPAPPRTPGEADAASWGDAERVAEADDGSP